MSTPEVLYCEVCGKPMEWSKATIGKYSPLTGEPERYVYYQCSKQAFHLPKYPEPGPTKTNVGRKYIDVLIPDRPR